MHNCAAPLIVFCKSSCSLSLAKLRTSFAKCAFRSVKIHIPCSKRSVNWWKRFHQKRLPQNHTKSMFSWHRELFHDKSLLKRSQTHRFQYPWAVRRGSTRIRGGVAPMGVPTPRCQSWALSWWNCPWFRTSSRTSPPAYSAHRSRCSQRSACCKLGQLCSCPEAVSDSHLVIKIGTKNKEFDKT